MHIFCIKNHYKLSCRLETRSFCDVILSRWVSSFRRFERSFWPLHRLTVKIKALLSFETAASTRPLTQHNISEGSEHSDLAFAQLMYKEIFLYVILYLIKQISKQ